MARSNVLALAARNNESDWLYLTLFAAEDRRVRWVDLALSGGEAVQPARSLEETSQVIG